MKVLFLSHKFYPEIGGTEANSEFLASSFFAMGAQIRLLTWTVEKGDKEFPFEIIRDPSVYEIIKAFYWADIVFENSPVLRMSWVNFFIRKPFIVVLNTWIGQEGKKSVLTTLKLKWLGRAKYVVAVSNAVRKKCWINALVIENAYDERLFRKTNFDETLRKNFVFLGRLVSDKGAHQAVEAFSRIRDILSNKNTANIKLTIIGTGPEMKNLKIQAESTLWADDIEFKGALSGRELVDTLNEFKYILIPSAWEEPFGLVALEGMACGCIPIVSDGGGLPDAVGDAGVTFKRNDVNDMVTQLLRLISDDSLQQLLKANAKKHLASHSQELVAKKYFELIQSVVNKYESNIHCP